MSESLLHLAAVDPGAAYTRALDGPASVTRLRAAGLAAKELGLLTEGLALLKRALELATGREAAQVRMNLVGLLAAQGDLGGAMSEAAKAEEVLDGLDAARLAANKACALARAGRLPEAEAIAAKALPRLRDGRDPVTLTGLLLNLGLARAFQGSLGPAEAALTEAVAASDGLPHQNAMARGNLAWLVARSGDVPRALQLFEDAESALTGERLNQCRLDQAEALIQAGLPREARPLLARALRDADALGYGCDVADGLFLLAHAELADGDPERAALSAERARAAFAAQERTGWMLLAEHLLLRARWASGDRSPIFLRTAVATADRLDRGGWTEASAEARIIAARVALALGRPAGHLLAVRTIRGPAALRASAWHAAALERWSRGDRRGAQAAIWSGLTIIEEHAEIFGAQELRARAAGRGAELAELGLRLARSARELLTAEERRRAVARPAAVRPPSDPEQAAALRELRSVSSRHTAEIARGRPSRALADRLAALEATVRARTLRRSPDPGRSAWPGIPALSAALGDRVLFELVRVGPELHAVTVQGNRPRRHHLCSYAEADNELRKLQFALRRGESPPNAAYLDELLLRRVPDEGDLVIAPTGSLHALPWAALPSLAGRPVTVVPSAAAWLRASARPAASGRTVLVAGPDLEHSGDEIDALRALYPHAVTPTAAEDVRDALDGAALAHLAAHGEFREDGALFSRLRLTGGPLLVYDLEQLATPPHTVVLSACDLGRSQEGDAVLGMAGVLLALGTATVIAGVAPVHDKETAAFMTAFHTALATGLSPARALASVPRTPGTMGFLCFGV
ncbi:CHAT domain-containing protein [Spirillospora sp. CA-294931]|uniref:CHAT domain-containing protein n=1 Tax=Spirillospora sp. CA-294931 TaxID=3240042 RepID=UPI003D91D4B9